MFIASGHLVNLMFGANAPLLAKLIVSELAKETACLKGERERDSIPFDQLTPVEQERFDATEAIRKKEEEAKEKAIVKKKIEDQERLIDTLVEELIDTTIVVYLPFLYNEEEETWTAHNRLLELVQEHNIFEKKRDYVDIDSTVAAKLFYDEKREVSEELSETLDAGKCMVAWLEIKRPEIIISSPAPSIYLEEGEVLEFASTIELPEAEMEEEPDPLHIIVNAIYGAPSPPVQDPQKTVAGSLAAEYSQSADVRGIWTPNTHRKKAESVQLLFPDYAEQFKVPEPLPPPPVIALVFKADAVNEELLEALAEYENMIVNMGFFDYTAHNRMKQVASSLEEFKTIRFKSRKEMFVVIVDVTKEEALLTLAQCSPIYISPTKEVAAKDHAFFFPPSLPSAGSPVGEIPEPLALSEESQVEPVQKEPEEEPQPVQKEPSATATEISEFSYDPLMYKEQVSEAEDDTVTIVSGLVVS